LDFALKNRRIVLPERRNGRVAARPLQFFAQKESKPTGMTDMTYQVPSSRSVVARLSGTCAPPQLAQLFFGLGIGINGRNAWTGGPLINMALMCPTIPVMPWHECKLPGYSNSVSARWMSRAMPIGTHAPGGRNHDCNRNAWASAKAPPPPIKHELAGVNAWPSTD
jgi:hypothetical protein